jgi:hypothetical protein
MPGSMRGVGAAGGDHSGQDHGAIAVIGTEEESLNPL